MIKSAFSASDNQTLYRNQMKLLIQTGCKYSCRVTVDLAGRRFNAKSMMHIGDIKAPEPDSGLNYCLTARTRSVPWRNIPEFWRQIEKEISNENHEILSKGMGRRMESGEFGPVNMRQ